MNPGPMAEDAGMESAETAASPKPASELASVFIPKEALGEREVKTGDTITLTVRDVDPDSGEVEACLHSGYEGSDEPEDYRTAIDNMPESTED